MAKTITLRSSIKGCVVVLTMLIVGCAANRHGASIALKSSNPDEHPSETTLATLTHIDPKHQVVTLREADGELSTVAVGDSITLGRMEVGDKVRIEHAASLGFELLEPGQSIEEMKFSDETLPFGVLFGRKTATTVEIVKVESGGESATCRSEDGSLHRLKPESEFQQTSLAHMRPGDDVTVACTEKLNITLQR